MPFFHSVNGDLLVIRQDDHPKTNGSSTPEINGSPAGFLALVLSLSIFVVLCCVAIFWLLKYHQPTEDERVKRKVELDAARARKSQSVDPRSWMARIRRAFGGKGQWVQAADEEEEYEATSTWRGGRGSRDRSAFGGGSGQHRMANEGANGGPPQSSSTSTVELSVPSRSSSPTTPGAVYFPAYDEPFTGGVVSPGPSMMSPTSSYDEHAHERARSMAAEIGYDHESLEDDRHFSVQSLNPDDGQISMRKWDNGTKFREAIR